MRSPSSVFRGCGLAAAIVPLAASALVLFAPLGRRPVPPDEQASLRGGAQPCNTTAGGICRASGNCVSEFSCAGQDALCLNQKDGAPCGSGLIGFNPNDTCQVPQPPGQGRCTTAGPSITCTATFHCKCDSGGTSPSCIPDWSTFFQQSSTSYCLSN